LETHASHFDCLPHRSSFCEYRNLFLIISACFSMNRIGRNQALTLGLNFLMAANCQPEFNPAAESEALPKRMLKPGKRPAQTCM
jgi:hypothetical protein